MKCALTPQDKGSGFVSKLRTVVGFSALDRQHWLGTRSLHLCAKVICIMAHRRAGHNQMSQCCDVEVSTQLPRFISSEKAATCPNISCAVQAAVATP